MRFLVLAMWLLGAATAAAQTQTAPPNDTPAALARVYACAQVSDERERLACYDAAVGRLRQAETRGEFAGIDRERARVVERETFGFRLPSLGRILPRFGGGRTAAADTAAAPDAPPTAAAASASSDSGLAELQMVVDRVVERPLGYHAFVMTNGQVWAQVQPGRVGNVRAGSNVTVRRAMLGSFMLTSERGGAGHRVRREE
jgi:hypothetical protein